MKKSYIFLVFLCFLFVQAGAHAESDGLIQFGLEASEPSRHAYDQFNGFGGSSMGDLWQVPAEFGYDSQWNSTLVDPRSSVCARATGNQVAVINNGAGNTTVIESQQSVEGNTNATCNFYR